MWMKVCDPIGWAFGIRFCSTLAFTEIGPEALPHAGDDTTAIEWQDTPTGHESDSDDLQWMDADGAFQLRVPGIARFAVTPRRITVHPAPGADERSVRTFLFGSAVGALLQLRGLTVLHGSAVGMPDGGAAVFCGPSTAGKSTLAAALAARGHPALADDITAIRLDANGQGWCLPGLARTKLWRDALQHLGLEHRAGDGTRVMPDIDKHSLSVVTADKPMPLRRFYELQALAGGELSVKPVAGIAKLNTLLSHAYRPRFLQVMGRQADLLRSAAALVPRLQMSRIQRPRQGQTLDAIVAQLEAQWRA